MKVYPVENTWTITVCTEMQNMKVVLCMTNFTFNIYSTTIKVQQHRHPSTYNIQFFDTVCAHSMNQPFTHWHRDDWDEYGLRFLYPCEIKLCAMIGHCLCQMTGDCQLNPKIKLTRWFFQVFHKDMNDCPDHFVQKQAVNAWVWGCCQFI